MANYTVTPTAQTLDTIMGTDFDSSKTYSIHINQCAPGVLQVIPGTKTDNTLDEYDGSRGTEYPEFTELLNITNGAEVYFKSSTMNDIDIYVVEANA